MGKLPLPPEVPADAEIVYDVTFDDGKRRFIYWRGGRIAYRNGVVHRPSMEAMTPNSVFALTARVDELEQELNDLRIQLLEKQEIISDLQGVSE